MRRRSEAVWLFDAIARSFRFTQRGEPQSRGAHLMAERLSAALQA
jgi:hypothetical protein